MKWMSIFAKPISQLTCDDLQELLDERAVENVRLEFKLETPNKDETMKKLSSFANTFGGFMVIGAKASSSDGRIESLPGVDVQDGYRQRIVDWSFSAASPPLTVSVSDAIPTPSGDGKFCYVIYTVESDVAPHFLNGRKGVWVRTDEFSARFEARLADENELRHLLDRRRLIRDRRTSILERARRRFQTYSNQARASGNDNKKRAVLELSVVPRFPARPLCEQEKLPSLVMDNAIDSEGGVFPTASRSALMCQHESVIVLKTLRWLSLFEANLWGMLFYCAQIEQERNEGWGIHRNQFVARILLFTKHAAKLLLAMGYSGPVLIETAMTSILGVRWFYDGGGWLEPKQGAELDDGFTFSIDTTVESLNEGLEDVAMEILRRVFFAVDWADLISKPEKLKDLVVTGYRYNGWTSPHK